MLNHVLILSHFIVRCNETFLYLSFAPFSNFDKLLKNIFFKQLFISKFMIWKHSCQCFGTDYVLFKKFSVVELNSPWWIKRSLRKEGSDFLKFTLDELVLFVHIPIVRRVQNISTFLNICSFQLLRPVLSG